MLAGSLAARVTVFFAGQKANLFAFEAGRRSSTGEGVYKFTMDGTVSMADSLKTNKK